VGLKKKAIARITRVADDKQKATRISASY